MAKDKKGGAVANASQMAPTKVPSKPTDKKELLNTYGATGTNLVDGFLQEEYNTVLSGKSGIEVFEMMRKSDAQVFATLLAMELPIRSTKWFIDPAPNDDGEIDDAAWEVQSFVEKALFEKMDTTWDSFIQEALTMLAFGYSLFEKVYTADDEGSIVLKKLGFRKQSTVYKWQQEDGSAGVQQLLPTEITEGVNEGERTVSIPASKLLIFSFRREGDNYEGTSVLRSAYKHWYIKDKLYKFDAVRHERQSVGVPVMYIPSGASEDDKAEALQIVTNIRSTEQTGIVMPGSKADGWEFEFADTRAGQSTNLFESIKHHNREIAKNILAQFLELGDTASGSRALSEDQSDLFLLSLTAVAQQIADTVNRFLIPELVDLNFDVQDYPKLKFKKLGDTDYSKLATTLATLTGAEILKPDENIEDFVRESLDLPARQVDAEKEIEDPMEDEGEDPEEPMDDGTDDGGDNPDGGAGDPLDSLQKELESLTASEDEDDSAEGEFSDVFDETIEAMEFALDDAEEFVAKGESMPEETKKKISEALKKAGGGQLQNARKNVSKRISETSDKIDQSNSDFQKATAGLRTEIDSIKTMKSQIPAGKKGTAQRKALAAKVKALVGKINALRQERNAKTNPLRTLRTQDIQTRKQVLQVIKERKAAIQAKVKAIRADLAAGRTTLKAAIEPMKADIKANVSQMKDLRQAMAALPRGDEKRAALKAMIDGLMKENDDNRSTQASLRTDYAGKADAGRNEIAKTKADSGLYHEHAEGCDCGAEGFGEMEIDEDYLELSARFNNSFIIQLQNECLDGDNYAKLKRQGFKFNDFEKNAPRPLTFAERKVNFTSLNRAMDTFNQTLEEKVNEITDKQKADLLEQIKKAVESNDIAAVGKIKARWTGELAQALTDVQKELFEIGKKTAATEMNVQVPPTKAEVRGAMRVQNDAVIEGMVAQIETAAKTAVTQVAAKKGGSITATSASEAIGAASESLDKVFEKAKNTLNTLGITGAVNLGRSSIFERYPEKVYGFQYSAILDQRTTETCRSLDGRVVKAGSPDFYNYSPPRHFNCRSIWVEILQDETFKPKFTGIPSSITANATIDTFKDLKAPIILKNSPAVKIVEEELADRKQKLADLEKTGQFPNRQEQHKARIKELENSLAKVEETAFNEYVKTILEADGIEFKEGAAE